MKNINSYGILNDLDFKNSFTNIKREEFKFPEETGLYTIKARTIVRYWANKGNLILLVETNQGRKLKFSFWNNTKYCIEPIPRRNVDKKQSIRYLKDGTNVLLTYEKSENAKITRVRDLIIIDQF